MSSIISPSEADLFLAAQGLASCAPRYQRYSDPARDQAKYLQQFYQYLLCYDTLAMGQGGWNRGLTKKTDLRVAANGRAISLALGGTGEPPVRSGFSLKSCGNRHTHCRKCNPVLYQRFDVLRRETSWNRGKTKETDARVAANAVAISKSQLTNHSWAHDPEKRRTVIPKLRAARLGRQFPKRNTRIERELRAEFNQRGLNFQQHVPMFNRFECDFVFPGARLIVEADGYPWHINKDHRPLYDAAREHSYTVWRFTDVQIFEQRSLIGELVEHYLIHRTT